MKACRWAKHSTSGLTNMYEKLMSMESLKGMQPSKQKDFDYRNLLLRRIREEIPDFVSPYADRFN